MNICRFGLMVFGLWFIVSGCSLHQVRNWNQFHGNLSNQGYQEIESGYALSSAWVSPAYSIVTSSPVIGTGFNGSEVLYIGTSDARLLALNTDDGRLLWQRRLAPEAQAFSVLSSASVADSGAIFTLTSRKKDFGRLQTRLVKVDQHGFRRWSFSFPENTFATGSPKTITFKGSTLILVQVAIVNDHNAHAALYIIEDEGDRAGVLSHKSMSTCGRSLESDSKDKSSFLHHIEVFWAMASSSPGNSGDLGLTHYRPFLMPTPAVASHEHYLLIATVDNLCGFGVYQWDGRQMKVAWQKEHGGQLHSSPAILPDNLMVFGSEDGDILGLDLITGVKRWVYQGREPVLATPAGPAEKYVFAVSKRHLIRLSAETGQPITIDGSPGRILLKGPTYASPALTLNRVYIASSEMLTFDFDLKTSSNDTGFNGNGLSSIALGKDGSVYAVAADGAIHKYKGTH